MDMVAAILSAALERRRAEDRLRASEARYRFLTEHSPDLITLHDATGRILYASPAALAMLGVRPELMSGSPSRGSSIPTTQGTSSRRSAHGRREKPDASSRTGCGASTGGSWTWNRHRPRSRTARKGPARSPRDPRHLRAKKMEARLAEGQTLSTIGMLAGGVAHEFNNVLAAIQGSVELLSMHAGGTLKPARTST